MNFQIGEVAVSAIRNPSDALLLLDVRIDVKAN